jgi:quinol-cytochrome oxidoreductase complex cytochrome b subunit
MPSKRISTVGLQLIQLFLLLVPIATAVIVLTYLGPWIHKDDDQEIDQADWRRKWLVIFAWLTVLTVALNILIGAAMLKK